MSFLKRRTSNATPHPLEKVIKEGTLAKQGGKLTRKWQQRYFVLKGTVLLYYEAKGAKSELGEVGVLGAHIHGDAKAIATAAGVSKPDPRDFQIGISKSNKGKMILLAASNAMERAEWMRALIQAGGVDVEATARAEGKINPHSTKEGYLEKLSKGGDHWSRRYFILTNESLVYFRSKTDVGAAKKVSILGATVHSEPMETYNKPNAFSIALRNLSRSYALKSTSEADMDDWITLIRRASGLDDSFYGRTIASTSGLSHGELLPTQAPAPVKKLIAKRMSTVRAGLLNPNSTKEGYMQKLGGKSLKKPQTRYFVLAGGQLAWLKQKTDGRVTGECNMFGAMISLLNNDAEFGMQITPRGGKTYTLLCSDSKDLDEWLAALRTQTIVDPSTVAPSERGLGVVTPSGTPSRGTIDGGKGGAPGVSSPSSTNTTLHGNGSDGKRESKEAREARKQSTIAINVAVKGTGDKAGKGIKEGFLRKVGGRVKNVKRRYFRLFPSTFEYYVGPHDVKPLGSVALAGAVCEETVTNANATNGDTKMAMSPPQSTHVLNLSNNTGNGTGVNGSTPGSPPSVNRQVSSPPGVVYGFTITPLNVDRKYEVFCDTEDQADEWVQAIKFQIGKQVIEKVDSGSAREGYIRADAVGSAKIGYLICSGQHMLSLYRHKPPIGGQSSLHIARGVTPQAPMRPLLEIELLGAHVRPEQDKILKGAFVFSVTPRRQKGVSTRKQFFTAETKMDMDRWVASIRAQTEVRNEEALCFSRAEDTLFKNFILDDYTTSTELNGAYWAYTRTDEKVNKVNFENFQTEFGVVNVNEEREKRRATLREHKRHASVVVERDDHGIESEHKRMIKELRRAQEERKLLAGQQNIEQKIAQNREHNSPHIRATVAGGGGVGNNSTPTAANAPSPHNMFSMLKRTGSHRTPPEVDTSSATTPRLSVGNKGTGSGNSTPTHATGAAAAAAVAAAELLRPGSSPPPTTPILTFKTSRAVPPLPPTSPDPSMASRDKNFAALTTATSRTPASTTRQISATVSSPNNTSPNPSNKDKDKFGAAIMAAAAAKVAATRAAAREGVPPPPSEEPPPSESTTNQPNPAAPWTNRNSPLLKSRPQATPLSATQQQQQQQQSQDSNVPPPPPDYEPIDDDVPPPPTFIEPEPSLATPPKSPVITPTSSTPLSPSKALTPITTPTPPPTITMVPPAKAITPPSTPSVTAQPTPTPTIAASTTTSTAATSTTSPTLRPASNTVLSSPAPVVRRATNVPATLSSTLVVPGANGGNDSTSPTSSSHRGSTIVTGAVTATRVVSSSVSGSGPTSAAPPIPSYALMGSSSPSSSSSNGMARSTSTTPTSSAPVIPPVPTNKSPSNAVATTSASTTESKTPIVPSIPKVPAGPSWQSYKVSTKFESMSVMQLVEWLKTRGAACAPTATEIATRHASQSVSIAAATHTPHRTGSVVAQRVGALNSPASSSANQKPTISPLLAAATVAATPPPIPMPAMTVGQLMLLWDTRLATRELARRTSVGDQVAKLAVINGTGIGVVISIMNGYAVDQRVHCYCMRILRNVTYTSDGRHGVVKDRLAVATILASFRTFPTSTVIYSYGLWAMRNITMQLTEIPPSHQESLLDLTLTGVKALGRDANVCRQGILLLLNLCRSSDMRSRLMSNSGLDIVVRLLPLHTTICDINMHIVWLITNLANPNDRPAVRPRIMTSGALAAVTRVKGIPSASTSPELMNMCTRAINAINKL